MNIWKRKKKPETWKQAPGFSGCGCTWNTTVNSVQMGKKADIQCFTFLSPLGSGTYLHVTTLYMFFCFSFNTHGITSSALRLFWREFKAPRFPFREYYKRFANTFTSCFNDFPCFSNFFFVRTASRTPALPESGGTPAIVHVNCQMFRRGGLLWWAMLP